MAGEDLWYAGAVLALLSNCLENFGFTLQKLSSVRNSRLQRRQQLSFVQQPLWLTGSAIAILGALGGFSALALTAQSIIAPIGSVSLIANIVFARLLLGETVSRRDLASTALIILGGVLSVSVGNHSAPQLTLDDFYLLFRSAQGLTYCALSLAMWLGLIVALRLLQRMKLAILDAQHRLSFVVMPKLPLIPPTAAAAVAAAAAAAAAAPTSAATADTTERKRLQVDLAQLRQRYGRWERLHPFLYCMLSGVLGATSEVFGKMVAELVSTSIGGSMQLLSPFPYLFVLLMLLCILVQIHYLAEALLFFDALYCVPMFQCCYILMSTLGGALFFDELTGFTTAQMIAFNLGVAMVLLGIVTLAVKLGGSDRADGASVSARGSRRISLVNGAAVLAMMRKEWQVRKAREVRSRSLNWPDTARSKGKRERDVVEAMGTMAARLTLHGQMRLPAHVEESLQHDFSPSRTSPSLAHLSPYRSIHSPSLAASSRQPGHRRCSSLPTYSALGSATNPGEKTALLPGGAGSSMAESDPQQAMRTSQSDTLHSRRLTRGGGSASATTSPVMSPILRGRQTFAATVTHSSHSTLFTLPVLDTSRQRGTVTRPGHELSTARSPKQAHMQVLAESNEDDVPTQINSPSRVTREQNVSRTAMITRDGAALPGLLDIDV